MATIRPYKLTNTLAIDLNLVTSIELIENPNKKKSWQIIMSMYYAEPIVLDYETKAQAQLDFNSLMKIWPFEEKSNCCSKLEEQLKDIQEELSQIKQKCHTLESLQHSNCYLQNVTANSKKTHSIYISDGTIYGTDNKVAESQIMYADKLPDIENITCIQLVNEQILMYKIVLSTEVGGNTLYYRIEDDKEILSILQVILNGAISANEKTINSLYKCIVSTKSILDSFGDKLTEYQSELLKEINNVQDRYIAFKAIKNFRG